MFVLVFERKKRQHEFAASNILGKIMETFLIQNLEIKFVAPVFRQKPLKNPSECFTTHTLKLRPGRGGLIPEMIQVCDYDILIVLVELKTLI